MTLRQQRERSYSAAFGCPECGYENGQPQLDKTEDGTPVAICDGCGLQVSRQIIAEAQQRDHERRQDAILRWAGWK